MAGYQTLLRTKARWVRRKFIPKMAELERLSKDRTELLTELGNIGVAKIIIPQISHNEIVYAHSKISNNGQPLSRYFKLVVTPQKFATGIYPNNNGDGVFDRKYDTESKILEYVANVIGDNRKLYGYIYLYTERKPCPMCKRVIRDFRMYYPNIKIDVYCR